MLIIVSLQEDLLHWRQLLLLCLGACAWHMLPYWTYALPLTEDSGGTEEAPGMHASRPEGAILPKGVSQRMRLPWGQGLAGQELTARKAESVVRRWQARTRMSRDSVSQKS